MLSTSSVAAGAGTVAPAPLGTSCGTGCYSYTAGQQVTITPTGTNGAILATWTGDCAGQGATCTLTMSSAKTAVAVFRPNMNIMFVTNGMIDPVTIGSNLAGGDAFCASSAAAALLGGTNWRAWLATSPSTTNINAATHVGASTTGWLRPDGRPFATSMSNLIAGQIYYPPRISEKNLDRGLNVLVATGSDDAGNFAFASCVDWTQNSGATYLAGNMTQTTHYWITGDSVDCTKNMTIYCFENDSGTAQVVAPVIPANGRRAFMSKTSWLPSGVTTPDTGADALCQGDAGAAGLPRAANYRALLATSVAATDATRFNLSGAPWYRVDGAQIVNVASDLAAPMGNKMLTTMNVDPTGAYAAYETVWTGSGVAPGVTTNTNNCVNWTSAASTDTGWTGLADETAPVGFTAYFWSTTMTTPCNTAQRLYCLEN
jgi:hypothetical protein